MTLNLNHNDPSLSSQQQFEMQLHEARWRQQKRRRKRPGDPNEVDYDSLLEEEKERYSKFVEAWYAKLAEKDPNHCLYPLPIHRYIYNSVEFNIL